MGLTWDFVSMISKKGLPESGQNSSPCNSIVGFAEDCAESAISVSSAWPNWDLTNISLSATN